MAPSKKKDSKSTKPQSDLDKIIDAAFSATEQTRWCKLSLSDIARPADMPLAEMAKHVNSKADILSAYLRRVDSAVLENVGEPDPAVPPKDRLFDVIMERFEMMNERREPFIRIIKSIDPDPYNALENLLRLKHSMELIIEGAGLKHTGIRGKLRLKGVTGIYLVTLKTWMDDDSPDLSATMVKLDKLLKRAEQLAKTLGLDNGDQTVLQ